jgi:hypothetical protein
MSDPQQQQAPDADLVQKMSQPIDTTATYEISGQAVVGLMQIVDEVPMKYARQLLPAIVGSLEKVDK